jgi:hypothetical protein
MDMCRDKKSNVNNILFIVLIVITFSSNLFSQTSIQVIGYSEDITGERLIYLFKEEIRKSKTFDLVGSTGDRWQIVIKTMPKEKDNPNISTIYLVVWNVVFENICDIDEISMYYSSTIGYCGMNVVLHSAQSLVAQTDEYISDFLEEVRKNRKKK